MGRARGIGLASAFAYVTACGGGGGAAPPVPVGGDAGDAGDAGESAPACGGAFACAGVAPNGCGDGFAFDGAGGCTPIQPAAPCPAGQVAWLGETTCHDVAPCPDDPWGDAPDEPSTAYVDAAATAPGDGTRAHPWPTIDAALAAAQPNAVVALAAGKYPLVLLPKPVRLWGRCPSLVEIHDLADDLAVGMELHGVAWSGARGTFAPIPASVIDRAWIHDCGTIAVAPGPLLTITRTLIENSAGGIGGESIVADQVALRDVDGHVLETYGGSTFLRGLILQRVAQPALAFDGSAVVVDSAWIDAAHEPMGGAVETDETAAVYVTGSAADVVFQRSVISGAQGGGIDVEAGAVTVASTVVSGTRPSVGGANGFGIYAHSQGYPESLVVRSSRLDGNATAALTAVATTVDIDGLLVADTATQGDGSLGRGVEIGNCPGTTMHVAHTRITKSHEVGLLVSACDVDVADLVVDATTTNDKTSVADGVVVDVAVLNLDDAWIGHSARAGLSTFAGIVNLSRTELVDNGIDLDGESSGAVPFKLTDRSDNVCVAGDTSHPCAIASSNLAPPKPLAP